MPSRSHRTPPARLPALAAAMTLALGAADASASPGLPLAFGHAAFAQGAALDGAVNPAVRLYAQGSILAAMLQGPWREYARNRLIPDTSLALDLPPVPDREQAHRRDALVPSYARHLISVAPAFRFDIEIRRERINETPMMPDSLNGLRFDTPGAGLDRTLVTPTYSLQLDSRNAIGVSAVLAYQQYSTLGFGSVTLDEEPAALPVGERSLGTGVRLGMESELAPGLSVGAAYQSRIAMDPFYRYRSVYMEPGQFDIPATANVGLALDATGNSTLSFDVRHIRYSEVRPFTSVLLPNRFLSLLGDGTSPRFGWQDLTVYQVGWQWENDDRDLAWNVSWSSGRQPAPTSRILERALASDLADSHWVVGVSRHTGDRSQLSLAASYTPSDYFLGLDGRGFEADSALDRMEVEARWSLDF